MAERFLQLVSQRMQLMRSVVHDPSLDLKYNKFYIGLAKDGQPRNFVVFRPKKGFIRFEPRLKHSPETQERLESAGLDVMDYDGRWRRYRIRLQPGDIEENRDVLKKEHDFCGILSMYHK